MFIMERLPVGQCGRGQTLKVMVKFLKATVGINKSGVKKTETHALNVESEIPEAEYNRVHRSSDRTGGCNWHYRKSDMKNPNPSLIYVLSLQVLCRELDTTIYES